MPDSGHVAGLITAAVGDVGQAFVDGAAHEVSWVGGSHPGRKRMRLNRKTPAHAVYVVPSRPRVWKRLRHVGLSSISVSDHKRRGGDQNVGECSPPQVRTGVG